MPSTATNHSSQESSSQPKSESLLPLHTVIIFLITTLGGYLQIQYQSRNISPFKEHGNILLANFVTLSMYAVGLIAEFKLQNHHSTCLSIIKRFTPLIGILVILLLMIILFPLLGLVAFILWALFMVEAVIRSFQEIYQSLRSIISQIHEGNFHREDNISTRSEENELTVREENGLHV